MRLNKNRAKTALTHLGNGKMTSLMYGLAWLKDLPDFPRNSYCRGDVRSRVDCGSASPGVDSCCNHIDHVLKLREHEDFCSIFVVNRTDDYVNGLMQTKVVFPKCNLLPN